MEKDREEMQRGEIVRIIEELRAKGWTDSEIVDFLLKIESD